MPNNSLLEVLKKCSSDEIKTLRKILWPKEKDEWNSNIEGIDDRFQWISSSMWGYIFKDKTYSDIIKEVAKKIDVSESGTVSDIEKNITQKVLKIVWEKLSLDKKKEILEKSGYKNILDGINQDWDNIIKTSGATFVTMFVATLISLTGIGIVISGILILLGLKSPDYETLIPAIIYVGGLRKKYIKEKK